MPPCVIASHGLLSSKDSEKYIGLGERLSREEIAMLRFDVRGIGESEGRLEDDTITRRITDLGAAIDYIPSRPGLGKRIGLVGSSLGGYVSLFKAAVDKEIRALVIWATPLHLNDLKSKEETEEHPLPAEPFFEDLPRHRLESVLGKISNGLVIHGTEDELVPVEQAQEIFRGSARPQGDSPPGRGGPSADPARSPPAGHRSYRGVVQEVPLRFRWRSLFRNPHFETRNALSPKSERDTARFSNLPKKP